jgi:hypothetical protein
MPSRAGPSAAPLSLPVAAGHAEVVAGGGPEPDDGGVELVGDEPEGVDDVVPATEVIVHVNVALAEELVESVAVMVTPVAPALVGVPEMIPVDASIERPCGSPLAL